MSEDGLAIGIRPVGVAHITDEPDVMVIETDTAFSDALLRIEEQEHLLVLYWMHGLGEQDRNVLQVHPRGDLSRPLHGVFATHSPMRPNPIGVTRVELVKVEATRLFVRGLDARDGSPVIDVKSG